MAELPVPTIGADEVHRVARSVLARSEFQEARPSWWQQLLQFLADLWAKLFDLLSGGGRGSIIGTAMLIAVAVLLVLAVIRFTRGVQRDQAREVVHDHDVGRTAADWEAEAREHELRGEWRDAVRCHYRALLAELAAEGLVEEVAGRTSGEYLALVGVGLPDAAAPFEDATRAFEAAWYGHEQPSSQDVAGFRDAAAATARAAGIRRSRVGAGA